MLVPIFVFGSLGVKCDVINLNFTKTVGSFDFKPLNLWLTPRDL